MDSYNTSAGDDGAKLSGGQRQWIIIARALLRNALILILDEATAYADMENQHKIQKSLEELCKDKTILKIR
nr:ATP-binding cassette domain-containing protein [Treponema sp. Marseille-Q3903]